MEPRNTDPSPESETLTSSQSFEASKSDAARRSWLSRAIDRLREEITWWTIQIELALSRFRQWWAARTTGPSYELNPLGVRADAERPTRARLHWRWERSLSRDLLGKYGLALVGVAVLITMLSYIASTTPSANVKPSDDSYSFDKAAPSRPLQPQQQQIAPPARPSQK